MSRPAQRNGVGQASAAAVERLVGRRLPGHILLPESSGNVNASTQARATRTVQRCSPGNRIGSIAKRFTRAASLRLMEQDELSLDDMLQKSSQLTIGVRQPQ